MKTKPFVKKLVLNKETITHLGNEDMKDVQAGEDVTVGQSACLPYAKTCPCQPHTLICPLPS